MAIIEKAGPLLEVLIQTFPQMSRSKIKQMLHNGRIRVDGKIQKQFDLPINKGSKIEIGEAQVPDAMPPKRFLRIVYEDRYLVVIEKRPGILSMATSHHSLCLKDLLDNYFERTHQRCHAHLVHRLDRDTSGLMLFAKSREVQQLFQEDWKGIVFDRRYVAVSMGHFPKAEGTIQSYLKDNKQYFTYSSPVDNGGKWAVTHYRVLERGEENDLVEARLDTGRKNQIRVHFADLGHPVLGDKKYGALPEVQSNKAPYEGDNTLYNRGGVLSKDGGAIYKGGCAPHKSEGRLSKLDRMPHKLDNATPKEGGRLFLHAYRLYFIHPVTGEELHFDTSVPKDFLKEVGIAR